MNAQEVKQKVNDFIRREEYDKIKSFLLTYKETTEHDNDLAMLCYLCTIYEQEKNAGQPTIFSKVSSWEALLERYTKLKFFLRRMDFDVLADGMDSFYLFLSQNNVSQYELLRVIDFCVVNKDKILQKIKGEVNHTNRERVSESSEGAMEIEELQSSEKGICFILCTNDEVYMQECLYYINCLKVPDGYWVDVLTVEEAKSMTAGYNEAMAHSKAKYKVYLHQDTFIIDADFIQKCLDIFQKDEQIGMIGNIGVRKMPDTGVMWDADRFGMLYEQHIYETEWLMNRIEKVTDNDWLEVDAIDGFIMVTQYDVWWREDLFDKWDFYDCSQSMEFIRQGYKVVVPKMQQPWCLHDCGFINLSKYDDEREKFVEEYLWSGERNV